VAFRTEIRNGTTENNRTRRIFTTASVHEIVIIIETTGTKYVFGLHVSPKRAGGRDRLITFDRLAASN